MAHRLAWFYITGIEPLKTEHIDHLDHDRTNNSFANLKLGTLQKNQKNRNIHKNNKSGQMGVYKNSSGKWYAQIWVNGKGVHLGTFDTYSKAVKCRKDGEIKYGYHVNHGISGEIYKR